MPAIRTSSKVLVTGGSGFIASWLVRELLERGFEVRTTVRSEQKAELLRTNFRDYSDRLELSIVEDVVTPGAFDESVQGIHGILHVATPMPNYEESTDPDKLISLAVQGNLGILESAKKSATVQRVVITSSIGAVWDVSKAPPFVYTEEIWNDHATEAVEKHGKDASSFFYSAVKTTSERSSWNWMEEHHPAFDLVTVLPSFTWGPMIADTTRYMKGAMSRLLLPLKIEQRDKYIGPRLLEEVQAVDVRDVAKVHVEALLQQAAGGQRFISANQTVTIQHIYDILNLYPIDGLDVPSGRPELLQDWNPNIVFSGKKSEDTLGIHYRPVHETIRDAVASALDSGWKQ